MEFHVVSVAHFDHDLRIMVFSEQVVVGLTQLYLHLVLHLIYIVYSVKKRLFLLKSSSRLPLHLGGPVLLGGSLDLLDVVQDIVVVASVLVPRLLLSYLGYDSLSVLAGLLLATATLSYQ
jgi:hypothetical protein